MTWRMILWIALVAALKSPSGLLAGIHTAILKMTEENLSKR